MSERTVSVVVCIDEGFLTPLLVMLRSACRGLAAGWKLNVFVFGYEIGEPGRKRLESGLSGLPVDIRWRTLDLSVIRAYWPGIRAKSEETVYYRLFLGEEIPDSIERLLFLDADLLVDGDLAELWELPFDGQVLQAVPDAYARVLHTRGLSSIEGLGYSEETPYFNAGVLLIDLKRWREENVGKRAVSLLWKYREQFPGRDQDALNCVLVGRWKRLPPTWNFHRLPEHPGHWETGGATADELREAFRRPAITHYIGIKPWSAKKRPIGQRRWWAEARRAGIPAVRRPLGLRLWETVVVGPVTRLRWRIRHGYG